MHPKKNPYTRITDNNFENEAPTKKQPPKSIKCPISFTEEEGEISCVLSNCEEPQPPISETLKQLIGVNDLKLAAEIFDKGRFALPTTKTLEHNANVTAQSLSDYRPIDATESKLCLQATALYSQGMQYLSRAENATMLCHSEFYMKSALKLLRLHNETIEALSKHRRGGEQRVVVQHVNVNDGGQAIVGTIHHGGGGNKKSSEVIL